LKGITSMQIQKIVSQQILAHQFSASSVCDLVEILFDSRSSSLSGEVLHVGGV
jgi:3-oxoacyl-[acyl-carrier protein] reductase